MFTCQPAPVLTRRIRASCGPVPALPAVAAEFVHLVGNLDVVDGGGVGGLAVFVGEFQVVDGGVPAVGGQRRPGLCLGVEELSEILRVAPG